MEQQYTEQFYQPEIPPGNVGSTGTDTFEEEPSLLEGKKNILVQINIFFESL